MAYLLGTAPNQVPTNSDLGKLAFMDEVNSVSNNPWMNTDISDVKPTLLLDFANSKSLDPRITFTRGSTGSYYDGKTTAMAEQNLLTYSQDFDNAIWYKSNVTITANTVTSPDGTTSADTLTATAGTTNHLCENSTLSGVSTLTYSVYAKAGTNSYVQLFQGSSTAFYANFDLSTGVLGTTGASTSASIQSIGNGWYRCSIVIAPSTASTVRIALVTSATATFNQSWTAAGTESIYLWGAQLEQRSVATAYTPTTSSPITNYIPVIQTAAIDKPRFDHNPVTGESLGLLIEEQRTNLATYSDDFSNAAWGKTNATVTANTVVSPDGTLSGDTLTLSTTTGIHELYATLSAPTVSTNYTISVYAKAGSSGYLQLIFSSSGFGSNAYANFDLSTGLLGSVGSAATATIKSVGNGWYRCTVTASATIAATWYPIASIVNSNTAARDPSWTPAGTETMYLWGAQVELGAFPTSYIPTTSASVTRSVDSASITGTNFSNSVNNSQGTLYVESSANGYSSNTATSVTIADTALSVSYISIYQSSSQFAAIRRANGVSTTTLTTTGQSPSFVFNKLALGFGIGGSDSFSVNGLYPYTQSSVSSGFANTQIIIGGFASNPGPLNGYIKKLAYYPVRLSNAELQEMTE